MSKAEEIEQARQKTYEELKELSSYGEMVHIDGVWDFVEDVMVRFHRIAEKESQLQALREQVKEAAMGEGFMYTNEILQLIDQLQED